MEHRRYRSPPIEAGTPPDDAPYVMLRDATLDHSTVRQVAATDRGAKTKTRIESSLHAAFEEEPLEDGMDHPAVGIIAEAFRDGDKQALPGWLREFSLDARRPAFAASVLRCLGRVPEVGTEAWRVGLVRSGLAVDNVQIRDAAIQAAEHWADPGLIDVLKAHSDTEQWLTDYIDMVVDDITS